MLNIASPHRNVEIIAFVKSVRLALSEKMLCASRALFFSSRSLASRSGKIEQTEMIYSVDENEGSSAASV